MWKTRAVILLVVVMFVMLLAVRAVDATGAVVSPASSGNPSSSTGMERSECLSLPFHLSIRSEHIEEMEQWVSYTKDGPTGVDGGLIHLLSTYRTCAS